MTFLKESGRLMVTQSLLLTRGMGSWKRPAKPSLSSIPPQPFNPWPCPPHPMAIPSHRHAPKSSPYPIAVSHMYPPPHIHAPHPHYPISMSPCHPYSTAISSMPPPHIATSQWLPDPQQFHPTAMSPCPHMTQRCVPAHGDPAPWLCPM